MAVNLADISNNDKVNIVCLYYARLRSGNPRYKDRWSSDLHTIASYYGFKYTNLKNRKDVFDAQFENGRAGWHQFSITTRPMLNEIYITYRELPLHEHEQLVDAILTHIEAQKSIYFSLRTKNPETVQAIQNKEANIVFDGLNVLKDFLAVGQAVFVVLGGDKPKDWEPGLIGMGIISQAPYDIGYDHGNTKNYKIQVDIKLLLANPIKREDLTPYKDTYNIIGIGPMLKWEPNQALSQIEEEKAIALMRAMLDMNPEIEQELTTLVQDDTMRRVKGITTMYIPVEVAYQENIDDAINESIDASGREIIVADTAEESVPYSKADFLKEAFIEESKYDTLVELLKKKKNVILQGAPGVGKTFIAKKLAYSILGTTDSSRIKMVQFHQSYSYEDFIVGYRPKENGFSLETGPFYEFCQKARRSKGEHFFIIDEINRGNLSRIFGELLMLIEASKRNESITLLYKNELFSIPENIYIIGMMNTADRSLAMIDYALRRRFSFFDMEPAFDSDGFKEKIALSPESKMADVIAVIKELNAAISMDDSLGQGFRIGHSYFCSGEPITNEFLGTVIEYEIIPLINEYWFDEPSKIEDWSIKLRNACKA